MHEDGCEWGWGGVEKNECILIYLRILQLHEISQIGLSSYFKFKPLYLLISQTVLELNRRNMSPTWFQTFQVMLCFQWFPGYLLEISFLRFFDSNWPAVFLLPLVPAELPQLMIIACLAATWEGENKRCWRGNHSLITVAQHFKLGNLLCSKSKLIT